MDQVYPFYEWFHSYRPISLSDFRVQAGQIPGILEVSVNKVVAVRDCVSSLDSYRYIMVHCWTGLLSGYGEDFFQTKFRLTWSMKSLSDDTNCLNPSPMEADLIPVVAIQQDTERPGLGSLTSQELWLIDHKSQQRSGLPVLGKPFSLGDIIEICERIIREYAALTINAPVPVCGSIWFESTLSDYLRGRRYTMQTAQGPIDDSNNNALEEHVLVAAPVSLSGYMPVDTKTNGQLKGGHGVGAYLSVSSISEPQSRAFASASVSQRDRSASAAMVPVHIPSVPTYELTPVEEPPLQMEFRGSRSKEAVDYGVTAKRKMDTLEEEKSKIKPNMKRAKTTDAGTEGAADVGTEPLISLAISKTMPLPDVVALLLQHGCQDITKMINLPACSEYPLSSGGFGDIFQGKLNDSTSVAIKCVRMVIDPYSSEHKKYLKCAAREIHTWSKLNHRYVSKLLGLAQFRGQIAMISPWAEHGALPGFLTRRPQHNRPRLCAQIAEGLAFLHKQKIVHGDLKGANILISENYEPLLTDFGNATLHDRSLQFTCTTAKSNFSLRWTAPELLDEAPSSFEADVYALGMTILEVITGKLPYAGMKDMAVINAIHSKRHPKRPEEYIPIASFFGDTLWSLLSRCWAFEPKTRPLARWAQDILELINPEGLIPSETMTSGRADAA